MRKWPMKWLFETQRWLTIKISIFFYTTISITAAGFACISNPCINGICIDDLNSTYTCYCIDGYTGIQCQTNWDECWSSPCLNGGSCIDGIASYNCTCAEGYTGENCEQDINECTSNPCLNGICTDALNGYECQCYPGYTGINCEIDQTVCNISDEIRCENNGLCIEGPGLTYVCRCQPGWYGQQCENKVNECLSSPCQNGAICIDMHANYACACTFGYTGHNCETELELCELNLCENGALCIMENEVRVCYCVPDYHGDKCQYQYDECLLKGRCLNGGTCIDGVDSYTCSCPSKVTGPNCECYVHTDGEYDCITTLSPYNTTTEHETITAFFETVTSFRDVVHLTAKTRDMSPTTKQVSFHWLSDTSPTHVTPVLTERSNVPNVTIFKTKISGTEHTIFKTNTESVETSQYSTSLTAAPTIAYTTEDRTLVDFYTSQTGITISEVITEITETTWKELSLPDTTTSKEETNVASTEEYATPLTENVTINEQISSATEIKQSTFDTTMKQFTDVTSDQFTSGGYSSTEYCEPHTTCYEVTGTWPENIKATEVTLVDDWNVTTFFTETFSSMQCSKTCLNGGTCHVTLDDSKCVCRFGWNGPSCENAVNIKVVAFTGKSYLIHYLNNGTSTVISLKLKTLSTLGVLFFTQVTSNMYMYLYVQDGFLKFQFSCGMQTMLFSETKYRISTGFETLVLATVKFNMNIQNEEGECNAALRINNTVAMSGEQTTATEQKLLNLPILYIGGFPKYLLQQLDVPVTNGIIGCMHSLQVDGMNRDIYMDAFDGFEITECSSLACISNPCHQAATCIEEGHSWNCICPSGYVGKVCNISVCDDNPCQFGATCVPYSTNGFLCLCPLGKHGLFCEQDLEISQPTFSSIIRGYSSFIAYRMPINSMFHTFELRLKFIPESMEQISLMVFIGQEKWQRKHSDYISLSFIKGYIALTWNLGAGPRRIFTPRPIMKKGKKMHSIKIGKSGPRAWLYVDGFKNITGKSLGRHTQLNVTPVIYIGGHESFNFENLPHDLPLHSGFAGCIYDVELHTNHIVLGLQKTHPITGRAVAQCGTSECSNYTCQHGGICLQYGPTFSCLCPDGWFGPVCAYRYNLCDPNHSKCVAGSTCVPFATTYECDCPVGRTGKYCEKIETQLSDIHFSGQRSYLQLLIPRNFHTKQFGLEFELKPFSDRSLVLYAVEPESEFFISLLLIGGILEFRIFIFDNKKLDTGTDIMSVKSGTIIPSREWTKIRAGRFGQKLYLSVNGITNSRVMPADTNVMLKKLLIYFGGSENLANVPFDVTSGLPVSYYGCIRKFFINYKHMALNENSISSGRNIADCDGTPCGADICANGGTCWLNTTLTPHCICPQEYQGDRCEIQVSCNLAPCRNGGRCVTNNNSLICHCPLGWIGSFCEKEMPAVTPFLKGNSYIIIDKRTIPTKKRHLMNRTTATNDFIYIKFSTTENNGLLLWNTKADNFFGIGIDEGNLKIVWSLNGLLNKFTIDTNLTVNNGVWHSVKFKSNDSTISLTVDNEEIYVESLQDTNNFVIFDDLFYIGGFPEKKVLNETNGIFISNFNGCIEEFAWNEHMVISNFKHYKGENVGNCFENKG